MSDNALNGDAINPLARQPDYSAYYNTTLTPEQETKSQAQMGDRIGDLRDYDLRGAWLADTKAAGNGHLPDTWKKPNHPTFSTDSQYSTKEMPGGTWSQFGHEWAFTPSQFNLAVHGPDQLKAYFQLREPDSFLNLKGIAPERLPGITSGAPAKPWGLDRDQIAQLLETQRQGNALNWQAAEDQRIRQQWSNSYLGRVLPQPDYTVDPGALVNPLTPSPSYRTPELNWPRWSARPADTEI
jgi:hypothetical protein